MPRATERAHARDFLRMAAEEEGEIKGWVPILIDWFRFYGFRVVHFEAVKREGGGYATFYSDDSDEGFVDIIAVGHDVVFTVEAKIKGRKPSLAQQVWLAEFAEVPGVRSRLWDAADAAAAEAEIAAAAGVNVGDPSKRVQQMMSKQKARRKDDTN